MKIIGRNCISFLIRSINFHHEHSSIKVLATEVERIHKRFYTEKRNLKLEHVIPDCKENMKKKIIIDTDAGLDDAQAILMALASIQVEVVAITTVMGNTGSPQVALNVLRILKLADRLDIPIYVGCNQALNGYKVEGCSGYHGTDGFGESPDPDAPDSSLVQKEDGVSALIRLSKHFSGDISVVCIGPLTNMAMALRKDKMFGQQLKKCYIMGGNYYGRGNVTVSAEFNFHVDPEAAREVLHDLCCPKTLLGWETCDENSFSWDWYKKFLKMKSNKIKYLAELEKYTMNKYYIPNINKGLVQNYEMADQFLMAIALDENIIMESKTVYADVELKGEVTRAQMVVDWNKMLGKEPNVKIVTKFDRDRAEQMLMESLNEND
ncbi:nucleoside hydrolase-like isoform X1 [Mytilus trossulus]|uniref:nucleoside hydrolase-like isoform X1 n=2 Tax=Mytilus trossulus TaxID=6551 RepID=UPI003007DFE3